MSRIIPIASGKGGTGKSVFSLNLAIALAYKKKTVVLVDLDLGASNLHTMLGIESKTPGVGDFINLEDMSLSKLMFQTEITGLFFLPGNSLIPGAANVESGKKRRLINSIKKIEADYVIIDLGAGSAYNTIDSYLIATPGLVMTTPEPTAILDAYYFLKTSLFRLLFLSFPPKSAERDLLVDNFRKHKGKNEVPFRNVIKKIAEYNRESGSLARDALARFQAMIIINMFRNKNEMAVGMKLRDTVTRNLGIAIEYIGCIPYDKAVHESIFKRMPVLITHPDAPFSRAVDGIADRLADSGESVVLDLQRNDEDLRQLMRDMGEPDFEG